MRMTALHKNHGGMERHGQLLAEGLTKRGHKVVVISTYNPIFSKRECLNGVEYHFIEGVVSNRYTDKWWKSSFGLFEALHREERFDLIWSQSTAGYGYVRYGGRYDVPSVLIFHGTSMGELQTRLSAMSSLKGAVRTMAFGLRVLHAHFGWESELHKNTLFIAVSKELQETVSREYSIRKERIVYVPNGIDPLRYQGKPPVPGRMGRILLMVGKVEKQKGVDVALKALEKLKTMYGDIRLCIVGDGEYLDTARGRIVAMGLEKNIEFTGPVANESMPEYYAGCDVFIMPTLRVEGFPLCIGEAMMSARPIIASDIGGIPSAIVDGETGILVKPGDVNGLVSGVKKLFDDRGMARRLAETALTRALAEFNVETMITRTEDVFEKARSMAHEKMV